MPARLRDRAFLRWLSEQKEKPTKNPPSIRCPFHRSRCHKKNVTSLASCSIAGAIWSWKAGRESFLSSFRIPAWSGKHWERPCRCRGKRRCLFCKGPQNCCLMMRRHNAISVASCAVSGNWMLQCRAFVGRWRSDPISPKPTTTSAPPCKTSGMPARRSRATFGRCRSTRVSPWRTTTWDQVCNISDNRPMPWRVFTGRWRLTPIMPMHIATSHVL